jgi:hypothetical protein
VTSIAESFWPRTIGCKIGVGVFVGWGTTVLAGLGGRVLVGLGIEVG